MKKVWLSLTLFLLAGTALAAPQTVKLSVPTMDCPVCPITIKKEELAEFKVTQCVRRLIAQNMGNLRLQG